jgi:OOP family OmpA-OmpF porin
MKKLLFVVVLLNAIVVFGQTKKTTKDSINNSYNKWTVECTVGQFKGVNPYAEGYFSSDPRKFLGGIDVNSFSLSARRMTGPKFGFRLGFHYDELKNISSRSLPFKVQQVGVKIEGVINANRLFNIEKEMGRFGLLLHGGLGIEQIQSKTEKTVTNKNYNLKELDGGLMIGVTPQYRIIDRVAIFADVTVQNNYRQHLAWDGSYSNGSNNLKGQSITTSFGISYSLGKDKLHGDWSVVKSKEQEEIDKLNKKVGDFEKMLNDTDKDGVPDYLDQENNSVAGVAVDSRGKMVDLNRNGVPDEIEKYITKTVNQAVDVERPEINNYLMQSIIDNGYAAVFFDTNVATPNYYSTEGLDFIRMYMKANPDVSIMLIGHADQMGNKEKNIALSEKRAKATREVLMKSGISADRLVIQAGGVDDSVDPTSEKARSLVRKVTFKIIKK